MSQGITIEPTVGQWVHYVLPKNGKHRPALIVEVHGVGRPDGAVNLLVAKDGANDDSIHQLWEHAASINHNQQYHTIGTWHWPENSQEALEEAQELDRIANTPASPTPTTLEQMPTVQRASTAEDTTIAHGERPRKTRP